MLTLRHRESRHAERAILAFLQNLPGASASNGDDAARRAWRMTLLAILAARHLEHPVDLERTLEMIAVQALGLPVEAVRHAVDPDNGLHMSALLMELETAGTSEAKLVRAVHRLADGDGTDAAGWCAHDRFLKALATVAAESHAAFSSPVWRRG